MSVCARARHSNRITSHPNPSSPPSRSRSDAQEEEEHRLGRRGQGLSQVLALEPALGGGRVAQREGAQNRQVARPLLHRSLDVQHLGRRRAAPARRGGRQDNHLRAARRGRRGARRHRALGRGHAPREPEHVLGTCSRFDRNRSSEAKCYQALVRWARARGERESRASRAVRGGSTRARRGASEESGEKKSRESARAA